MKKVKAVNELTVEAQKSKEQFNNFTKEYNDSKLAFYKDAEIKIKDQK